MTTRVNQFIGIEKYMAINHAIQFMGYDISKLSPKEAVKLRLDIINLVEVALR